MTNFLILPHIPAQQDRWGVSDSSRRLVAAQRLERRAHLRHEEQWLFPRREVPALVRLVEVGEVRVAALRPAPGGLVDLAGEDGERRRDGEVLGAEVRGLVIP